MKKICISIILIMILVLQMILPLCTNAIEINNEDETLVGAETSISVSLKRDSVDKNKINITATDTSYNITDLKYVHKYIKLEEIEYFEANNEDVHTISITPAKKIEESFEMDGYGSYTVYVKNEKGDRFLSRMTVKDPAEMPDITLTRDSDDMRKLEIQVTSKNNKIVKIKIARKEKYDDSIDFENQGEALDFESSNNVNVKYTSATQNGIYVVYAEDDQGNKSTSQTYLGETKTPIQAKTTLENKNRKAQIKIEDNLCKIIKVKVAKKSKINNINDFKTEGENIEIEPANSVNIEYVAPEDDTYMFYIEDEAGYKKMIQMRIAKENSINISVSQDDTNKKIVTIKASDSICNIVKIKVAVGENIDSDYFKTNGQELQITPGKEVETQCSISENCILNIYVEDEDGYKVVTTRNITGILADDKKDDSKPDDSKKDDSKPDDSKPDDSKPDDSKPDDSKPDDSKSDDSKSDDSKPDDSKPDDSKPDDSKPDDSKSDDSKLDDSKPDDSKPDDSKSDDSKSDDSKPDDSKPDDSKSDDSKPDDSKPDDNKQDDSKKDDNKQDDSKQDNKSNNNNSNNNSLNNASNNSKNTNAKETTTNNQTNISNSSANSSTTSQSNLPKTGWNNIMLIITIGIVSICATVSFIKYKKIKE